MSALLIMGFLKRNGMYAACVAFLTGILAVFCVQHLEIAHLRKEARQYRDEALTLANSNKALVASLENQNAAIGAMQRLSQARAKAAVSALAAARVKARKYALKAQRVQMQKNIGDDCASMRALVNGFVP